MEQIASSILLGARLALEVQPGPAAVHDNILRPELWAEGLYGPAAALAKKGGLRCSQVCICGFLTGGMRRVAAFWGLPPLCILARAGREAARAGVQWG